MGRGQSCARHSDRSDHTRLALRWFFRDKGRVGRTAGFICNISLLAVLSWIVLTLVHLGTLMLPTIVALCSDDRGVRQIAIHTLSTHSALDYVIRIQALLLGQLFTDLMISLALATLIECSWTVRRAQRQMPPIEFLASAISEGERPA